MKPRSWVHVLATLLIMPRQLIVLSAPTENKLRRRGFPSQELDELKDESGCNPSGSARKRNILTEFVNVMPSILAAELAREMRVKGGQLSHLSRVDGDSDKYKDIEKKIAVSDQLAGLRHDIFKDFLNLQDETSYINILRSITLFCYDPTTPALSEEGREKVEKLNAYTSQSYINSMPLNGNGPRWLWSKANTPMRLGSLSVNIFLRWCNISAASQTSTQRRHSCAIIGSEGRTVGKACYGLSKKVNLPLRLVRPLLRYLT